MYFVYVLRNSSSNRRYVGYTTELEERIRKHNTSHKGYTGRQPGWWMLVHCEEYKTKTEAIKRERFLKSGKGRDFLNSLSE